MIAHKFPVSRLYILFGIGVFLHIMALAATIYQGFDRRLGYDIIFYSTLDLALSQIVCFLVLVQNFSRGRITSLYITDFVLPKLERSKLILALLMVWAYLLAWKSWQLIALGVLRHDLIREYDVASLDYMLVSGVFKILTPIVIIFPVSVSLKFIALSGLAASVIITASRSELSAVIFYMLSLLLFVNAKNALRVMIRLALVSTLLVFAAILSTIFLQNRQISDGLSSLLDIANTFFRYRAFSYYLSTYAIAAGEGFDKIFFPFFGYISEYFNRFFGGSDIPIDSDFVSFLHYLGSDQNDGEPYLANVVYPWWSWFVGFFGPIGIIVKAIYLYCLLSISFRLKMTFTSILLLTVVLMGSAGTFPFLTLAHIISFLAAIFIDLYLKYFKTSTLYSLLKQGVTSKSRQMLDSN